MKYDYQMSIIYRSLHMPIMVLASSLAIVILLCLGLIRIKVEMQPEKLCHSSYIEKHEPKHLNPLSVSNCFTVPFHRRRTSHNSTSATARMSDSNEDRTKKRKQCDNQNEDRLSDLPDCVLLHILIIDGDFNYSSDSVLSS
ncbi:NPC intracellular cholesterol transporter 1 [Trifolium repens]|nr:NPC intracellular cholesterol transporter 1 [Trifolium repens]